MSNPRPASLSSGETLGRPHTAVTPPAAVLELLADPGWHVVFWYSDRQAHGAGADLPAALQNALDKSAIVLKTAPSKYIACMVTVTDERGEPTPLPTEMLRAFIQQMGSIGFVWFYETGRWYSVRSHKETS